MVTRSPGTTLPHPNLPSLQRFVEDELLRAPLLFDLLIDGMRDSLRSGQLVGLSPAQRATASDAITSAQRHRANMADYFMHSLRQQVQAELAQRSTKAAGGPATPTPLSLVEEDVVAVDVELSHTIEAIRTVAEHELLELHTYTSALVGDMDVARDHNPFRPETFTRATWAAANALPLSRSHQVAFMRHAADPLAHLLRRAYAASSSRLEAAGVEAASYRTLILATGPRHSRPGHVTFSPELQRVRDEMSTQVAGVNTPNPVHQANDIPMLTNVVAVAREPARPASARGLALDGSASPAEHWSDIARQATHPAERQSVELISRLFDAMVADERLPRDVATVVTRLRGPAMRLALVDSGLMDRDKHPLWAFINELAYACEMSPDAQDPERVRLLRAAKATAAQLQSEARQRTALYVWALERLQTGLQKRLARRLTAAASHVGALQVMEARIAATWSDSEDTAATLTGALDVSQLDTVPAALMDNQAPAQAAAVEAQKWLDSLAAGDWVRLFLHGRWSRAQLLWPGEKRLVWLFGDGASDATWAVRGGALLMMHSTGLIKTLRRRSIVGSAAARVHAQVQQQAA
jgi:hypothetical protein